MTASYKVLFISIIGHAAQFAFLSMVEEPHIQKTYNPPPPRRTRHNSEKLNSDERPATSHSDAAWTDGAVYDAVKPLVPPTHHIGNRSIDVAVVLLSFYMFCMAVFTPNNYAARTFLFLNAFFWRLWYALGLGYILDRQSKKKNWTRHFIKHGDTKDEAWRQWKSIYHLSMTMSHASLGAAAWKMYTLPPDWYVQYMG